MLTWCSTQPSSSTCSSSTASLTNFRCCSIYLIHSSQWEGRSEETKQLSFTIVNFITHQKRPPRLWFRFTLANVTVSDIRIPTNITWPPFSPFSRRTCEIWSLPPPPSLLQVLQVLRCRRKMQNSWFIAEQVQSVHRARSEVFVDISIVDLVTIRWQMFNTLCCETPITQINSYSQFNTRPSFNRVSMRIAGNSNPPWYLLPALFVSAHHKVAYKVFTMIYFNEWKLRGCVCIHR